MVNDRVSMARRMNWRWRLAVLSLLRIDLGGSLGGRPGLVRILGFFFMCDLSLTAMVDVGGGGK